MLFQQNDVLSLKHHTYKQENTRDFTSNVFEIQKVKQLINLLVESLHVESLQPPHVTNTSLQLYRIIETF